MAASAVESPRLGMTVMLGIALHNIPEGIAIAVPCLKAKPNQYGLAFGLATLSGVAEPVGALCALMFFKYNNALIPMEYILAFVSGIMFTVAAYELLPEARRNDEHCEKGWAKRGLLAGFLCIMSTEWVIEQSMR